MKKGLALAAGILLLGALISAQALVGRATEAGLRIREKPGRDGALLGRLERGEEVLVLGRGAEPEALDGLRAYWLKIVTMEGLAGWAYGGYLDFDPATTEEYVDEAGDLVVEKVDHSAAFGEGSLIALRVRSPYNYSLAVEALFCRLARKEPQVVFSLLTGELAFGSYQSLGELDFMDLVGDERREILAPLEEGAGDYLENSLSIYGILPGSSHYARLGTIPLGYFSGGGGPGMDSSSWSRSGPFAVTREGKKVITFITTSIEAQEQGLREVGKCEDSYELRGDRLVLTRSVLLGE